MANTVKYGIQESVSASIKHGIQKPEGAEWAKTGYRNGDKDATYKFDKQSGSGPSGNSATQTKGHGKHSSIGGPSSFVPKGKTSSPGIAKGSGYMTQKSGIKGKF